MKRKKGITARLRARKKASHSKADRLVYAAVDLRDGRCSRLTGIYWGEQIHRHHILERSRGGETTVENVISLSPDEHLRQVHGKRLRLSGNADITGGVTVEMFDGGWVFWKMI